MQISRSDPLQSSMASTAQRTAMSFDVDPRSHAMTVSVVDRRSGEVLQQMVYDKRLASEQDKARRTGSLVDVHA